MEKASIIESIIKVFNIISSMPLFIEALVLSLLFMIVMIIFYYKKTDIGKKITILVYIVTLVLLPATHFSFFIQTIDKMVENFVEVVFFPSVYAYIFMVIVTDIFLIKRLLNNKNVKWYNALEFVYFFIFQFLFFLALRLSVINSINIFDKASIYYNQNLTSVIQVLSYLFWIRIAIYIINLIINKISGSSNKKDVKPVETNNSQYSVEEQYNYEPVPDLYGNTLSNNINSNYTNVTQVEQQYENSDVETLDFNKNDTVDNSYDVEQKSSYEDDTSFKQDIVTDNTERETYTPETNNNSTNWGVTSKLNDLAPSNENNIINNELESQSNKVSSKEYVINNLDVARGLNTNYSIRNNNLSPINSDINNIQKVETSNFVNEEKNISSIQNSNNYDINSVLSNFSSNNNNNTSNLSNESLNIELSSGYEDSKNKYFDDFYD